MNSKFWNILLFAMTGVMLMRFFFPSNYSENKSTERVDRSGQIFKAPVSELEVEPIRKEIDFEDSGPARSSESVLASTPLCDYLFSTDGGVLNSIKFKKHVGSKGTPLETIYLKEFEEREKGCFLLAFDEKTPYQYKLADQVLGDNGDHSVTFETKTEDWTIRKTYFIDGNSYDIKLKLDFKPGSRAKELSPRIFVPGPFLSNLVGESLEGLVSDVDQITINNVSSAQEDDFGWKLPAIFGVQDKYFLHSYHGSDNSEFIKRCFFKRMGPSGLTSIFEGQKIKEASSVTLSFYMGPKSINAINAVDTRLSGVLYFGWFSGVGRLLVRLLEWLFDVFGNFGWAILILVLLVKLLFLPFSLYAGWRGAMYRRFESRHGGELQSIMLRYKDDMIKRAEALKRLHDEYGVSQGWKVMGMWPQLARLPILVALYRVLGNYIGLYNAPFVGWIVDLSAKDPYFFLPLAFGASMLLKQNPGVAGNDMRAQLLGYGLPIIMTIVFASFPAGLVLYLAADGLLNIVEEGFSRTLFGFGGLKG